MKKLMQYFMIIALLLSPAACSKVNANGYDNSSLTVPDHQMNQVEKSETTCKADLGTNPVPVGPVAPTPRTGPTLPNKSLDPSDLQQRRQLVDNYRAAAQSVADKTHNQHAQDLLKFLDLNGRVGVPQTEGMQYGDEAKQGKFNFLVVPLRNEDASLGEHIKQLLNAPAAAFYGPESNVLTVLDSRDFSDSWKGIIFLHELEHACAYNTQHYPWQDPWVFSLKERVTHQFENELINALGGSAYAEWKTAEVKRIHDNTTNAGDGLNVPGRGAYDPKLDAAFGPAASKRDQDLRATHTWFDALTVYYADRFGEDTNYHLTLLLGRMYDQNGLLPQQQGG